MVFLWLSWHFCTYGCPGIFFKVSHLPLNSSLFQVILIQHSKKGGCDCGVQTLTLDFLVWGVLKIIKILNKASYKGYVIPTYIVPTDTGKLMLTLIF